MSGVMDEDVAAYARMRYDSAWQRFTNLLADLRETLSAPDGDLVESYETTEDDGLVTRPIHHILGDVHAIEGYRQELLYWRRVTDRAALAAVREDALHILLHKNPSSNSEAARVFLLLSTDGDITRFRDSTPDEGD